MTEQEKSMIAESLEGDVLAAEGQTFRQMLGNLRLYALMAVYFLRSPPPLQFSRFGCRSSFVGSA
ncbi:hypothetical protein [Paraburkholderia hospita]|uniref:hypothetical protein n=1 Tax=Paraburkholderia hospita TaxID=169430 RepID=UPI001055989D|nr:hypothetical protein [Paraburkholderia hospita]